MSSAAVVTGVLSDSGHMHLCNDVISYKMKKTHNVIIKPKLELSTIVNFFIRLFKTKSCPTYGLNTFFILGLPPC